MKKMIIFLLIACCLFTACQSSQPVEDNEATNISNNDTSDSQDIASGSDQALTIPGTAEGPVVVRPLPSQVNLNELENCTLAISLEAGDIYTDANGALQMDATVWTYDLYDMVDIARLEVGAQILIGRDYITVESLERTESGAVLINGGLDNGGCELRTDEDTVYYAIGYSDVKYWYEVGKVTLPLAESFLFTDRSDLDSEETSLGANELMNATTGYTFTPGTTTIVIEDGYVTSMTQIYAP